MEKINKNIERQLLRKEIKSLNSGYGKKQDFISRNYSKNQSYENLLFIRNDLLSNPLKQKSRTDNSYQQGLKLIRDNPYFKPKVYSKQNVDKARETILLFDNGFNSKNWIDNINNLLSKEYTFAPNQLNKIFDKLSGGENFSLEIITKNGKLRLKPITKQNFEDIKNLITNYVVLSKEESSFSDGQDIISIESISSLRIVGVVKPIIKYKSKKSVNGFFPYFHSNNYLDLQRYQIYYECGNTFKDKKPILSLDINKSCILYALEVYGFEEEDLQKVIHFIGCQTDYVPNTVLKKIGEILNICLVIHKFNKDGHQITIKYNEKSDEKVHIASYLKHFFIYDEETEYTKFSIRNYDEIDEFIKDKIGYQNRRWLFSERNGKYFKYRENTIKLDSLNLIKCLHENKFFIDFSYILVSAFTPQLYEIEPNINNIENDQENCLEKDKREKKIKDEDDEEDDTIIIYADCESCPTGENHELLMIGFVINETYCDVVYNCNRKNFFNDIQDELCKALHKEGLRLKQNKKGKLVQNKRVKMYFHNAKYDMSLLFDNIYSSQEISKDGSLYAKDIILNRNIKVRVVDSYKHWSGKLQNAPKAFNLDVKKQECIAYTFYNKDNIRNTRTSVVEYKQYLREEEHIRFMNILEENKELFEFDGEHFNSLAYYRYYLKQDCLILKEFMGKYNILIKKITGLNCHKFLTISSIGHNFVLKNNCYKECFGVKRGLREFIQNCIKGGRVYANPKYRKQWIDLILGDLDVNSLYPAAMKRLCEEYGIPIGRCSKGENGWTINDYSSKSMYMVKIKITKINKTQQIPCVSYKDKKGLLQYTNSVDQDGITVYVDRITLEDYIKFQEIEYEIIEGIYWDSGYNTKLKDVIINLFNERQRVRKQDESLGDMIKLTMNSVYGKTGQRKSEERVVYKKHDLGESYYYENFGIIKDFHKNKFNTRIVEKDFDDSYSFNYIASLILSMSKRIMNEVFDIMNDNNMPVYYTDTDSIHCRKSDQELLKILYKQKYNKDLIGKELGQFSSDFKIDNCENVDSVKFICLAPKVYMDVLVGFDKENKQKKVETHVRIKGINNTSINHEIKKRKGSKVDALISIFEDLKNGVEIEFVLNPTKYDASFEYNNGKVSSREVGEFKRTLCF